MCNNEKESLGIILSLYCCDSCIRDCSCGDDLCISSCVIHL
jgi:hypothetical protein